MAAQRKPTFSMDELNNILNEALAKQKAEIMAEMAAQQAAKPKADTKGTDATIVKAFAKKGYKNIVLLDRSKPVAAQLDTVTVLTYRLWMQQCGRKVKPGEHAVIYRQFRLFHKTQTEVASVEERKAYHAKQQAAAERREQATA